MPSAFSSVRAAQYVRMSTEHQQYSTENQIVAIQEYARQHGMEIVRTFADYGKSGLDLAGREGLRTLIHVVESGAADFDAILVYDISRWGRFQDSDESAYYEYICKRAEVAVHYCAEQFNNDGSVSATLLKTVKRTMAGEYSRELSVKVFAGQSRLIELGFRQGGPAGYGLRRVLQDQHGQRKGVLGHGERKSIQTDRVILVPAPADEVQIVREIYDLFTTGAKSERVIADLLNARGLLTDLGRPWTRGTVHQVLTNPKYVGDNVYNRQSFKLKKRRVTNPPEMWIRRGDAFTPIVSRETFTAAQAIIHARHQHYTDDHLLDLLRQLLHRHGTLSGVLIDETDDMPSSSMYQQRFQTLIRAYRLIGYTPNRDYDYIAINRSIRERQPIITREIIDQFTGVGARAEQDPSTGLWRINEEFTMSIILARCRQTGGSSYRWHLRFDAGLRPDVTIAARMAPGNNDILDFYLFPALESLTTAIRLAPENPISLDVYRFPDLTSFTRLARRVKIQEAA